MSTAIATTAERYTKDQIDLVKRTVCQGATNDELALFIQQCQRTGLDPFARQIHAVKRGGKMTIQVGIDGFRLIAERTGESDGQDGPYWCGEDGIWKDVWLSPTPPLAAKVTVYRKGCSRGYTGVARLVEYRQPGPMWDRMPTVMLAKVAESIALRKGFPQELSGIYEAAELPESHSSEPEPESVPDCRPAIAAFAAAKTAAELKAAWDATPPEVKPFVVADKDRRKAEFSATSLTSAPSAPTPPKPDADTSQAELLSGAAVQSFLQSLTGFGLSWPAAAAQYGPELGFPGNAKVTEITVAQSRELLWLVQVDAQG